MKERETTARQATLGTMGLRQLLERDYLICRKIASY